MMVEAVTGANVDDLIKQQKELNKQFARSDSSVTELQSQLDQEKARREGPRLQLSNLKVLFHFPVIRLSCL